MLSKRIFEVCPYFLDQTFTCNKLAYCLAMELSTWYSSDAIATLKDATLLVISQCIGSGKDAAAPPDIYQGHYKILNFVI